MTEDDRLAEGPRPAGLGATEAPTPPADSYSVLAETIRAVGRCESATELYRELCRVVVQTGQGRFAWVGVRHLGVVKIVATAGDDNGYLAEVADSGLMIALDVGDVRAQGPTGRALSAGVRTIVNDFSSASSTGPWHVAARRAGLHASAAFPIRRGDVVMAALTVYADRPGHFDATHADVLSSATQAVSLGLDRLVLERRQTEQSVQFELRLRALEALGHSLVIADALARDQPVIYCSESFRTLTGYRPEEVFGRNLRLLQGPATDPSEVRRLGEAIRAGRSCTAELVNYARDGRPFWNRMSVVPLRDESGTITHFCGSLTRLERAVA